jgi:hypothetical protein
VTGTGHEERFPATRLSARCGFRKETIAETRCNGRDAPIPVVHEGINGTAGFDPKLPFITALADRGAVMRRTFAADFYI